MAHSVSAWRLWRSGSIEEPCLRVFIHDYQPLQVLRPGHTEYSTFNATRGEQPLQIGQCGFACVVMFLGNIPLVMNSKSPRPSAELETQDHISCFFWL